jgi:NAD(P)-dependent dehydrogenase (short-subunit alcohol dehydrogenase family)
MQINGSVFVVTGAGSGLGAETASNLVSAGGKVVIVDIDAAAGEAQAAQLGANARFAKTDVTDEASATAAIEMAVNEFGGLHGLVNCAGVAPPRKCSAAMARTIWPPLRAW